MRRLVWLLGVSCLMVSVAGAQEREGTGQGREGQSRRAIRVLENPYDIASFYRSNQGGAWSDGAGAGVVPYFGLHPAKGTFDPYAISSFYRTGGGGYYGQFWSAGVPTGNRQTLRRVRPIHGELFQFFPTILAPAAPLAEGYLGR
jgi:hypothetical protein